MTTFTVVLTGGSPWGFRLQGGREFNESVRIAKINPNSKAFREGLAVGDIILSINGKSSQGLNHVEVQTLIKSSSSGSLTLQLQRDTTRLNGHFNGNNYRSPTASFGGDSLGSSESLLDAPSPPVPSMMNGQTVLTDGQQFNGLADFSSSISSNGSSNGFNTSINATRLNTSNTTTNNNNNESEYGMNHKFNTGLPLNTNSSSHSRNGGNGYPLRVDDGGSNNIKMNNNNSSSNNTEVLRPPSPPLPPPPPPQHSFSGDNNLFSLSQTRTRDGQDAISHGNSQSSGEVRPNGSAAEFHGISSIPLKQDNNWGTQTLPARSKAEGRESKPSPTEGTFRNIAPVWKPSSAGPSSLNIKREYKPVRLDTSKKSISAHDRTKFQPDQGLSHSQGWRAPPSQPPAPTPLETSTDSVFSGSTHPPPTISASSTSSSLWATATDHSDSTLVAGSQMNGEDGTGQGDGGDETRLPPTQSPYITLLQKSRDTEENEGLLNTKFTHKPIMVKDDGHLPKGATYIGSQHRMDGDRSVTEDFYTTPAPKSDITSSTTTSSVKPVKYDGIGPLDKEGVPLANRKNVNEENQHQWYRQMYKSLHRTEKKEDHQQKDSSDIVYYDLVPEEKNTYKPTYSFPDDISDTKSEEGLDVGVYRPSYVKSKSKADDSGYRSEPEGRHKDYMKFRSKSTSSDARDGTRRNWNPPNVRSKIEVYRCQPRSIMDYEPGFSSIAFREAKSNFRPRSKSMHSPRDEEEKPHNPRIDKPGDFSQYSENYRPEGDGGEQTDGQEPQPDLYKKIQHGGDIPIRGLQKPAPEKTKNFRHQTTDVIRKSLPTEDKERRRKEEDENYRKKRLEELYEEERRKRVQLEAEKNAARKHHDFFTPAQKSPISPNRFDEVPDQSPAAGYPVGQSQIRSPLPVPSQTSTLTANLSVPPERRRGFQIQGKAKALFNFTAQNPRELSFRKGDTLYLLRQVDKNWFEGEHHGRAGIFPVNYVEVLTSIEAARSAALDAEGQARAKYNFTGQSSVELTLKKGETVTLLRHVDENWCEGRIHGHQGIFPTSYVEILREPSTPLITPAPSVITTPMAGTPEMLSPVSMEPPTPPPQPSPSAFSSQHTSNYNPYWQQHQQQPSSSVSQQPWGTISSISSNSGYNKNIANNGIGSGSGTNASNNRMQYDSYRTLYGGHDPAQSLRSPELQIYGHKGPISPASGPLKVSQPQSATPVSAAPMPKSNINIFTTSLAGGPNRQPKPEIKVSDDDLALQRYRALYAYRPQSEDELELREGDEVFVMERCDDGWYVGTSARTGQFGTFPGNYVQKL